jgi:type VI secretion system protein ImpJ
MQHLPVHWYEGAFLRPQHFQASDRFWSNLLRIDGQFDNPHNYGLVSIDFSREALANHQFELRSLRARMRDGTLIDLQVGDEPDRLDLSKSLAESSSLSKSLQDAFERESSIRIYLGVPKMRLGRTNVGSINDENSAELRYLESEVTLPDESWGGDDQEIQFPALGINAGLSRLRIAAHRTG